MKSEDGKIHDSYRIDYLRQHIEQMAEDVYKRQVLGPLKPEIASEVGGQTNVVLCATHDTASAVEGLSLIHI